MSDSDTMRKTKYKPTWDLASIPDAVWYAEHGRRISAKRKGNTDAMRELAERRWGKKQPVKKDEKSS